MEENALVAVQNYIDENLFSGTNKWSDYEFDKRSYERWAAYEILKLIANMSDYDAFLTTLYFMHHMDAFANMCEKKETMFMFLTARDTAEEIVKQLVDFI